MSEETSPPSAPNEPATVDEGMIRLEELKSKYPEKFAREEVIFGHIHRGDRIFIGTGCGEPQYLVGALTNYVISHPKAIFDAEVLHVWSLGISPYTDEKLKQNFRHNSFFIGNSTRDAVNTGLADYTPIFLSDVPDMFYKGYVPIDVALVQVSLPDSHGYMSLGISVDIDKAATEMAKLVIVQVNSQMPRVLGDGFINIRDVAFVIPHDEPLLEFKTDTESEVAQRIGKHVSYLIRDGDTIQVGYGSIPDAIMSNLRDKKHLGVHSELLSDGMVDLMKRRVIDNTRKKVDRGRTVASFCMGKKETYDYLHDNPAVEFRTIDYTNDPLVIARHRNMTAINSALQVDLTGQATAESLGRSFYSGIGGQANFMRGALLSEGGKTILALPSTADNGEVSRIVPFLDEGAAVSLHRGDLHYLVTEFGIVYLHGKNIRERAMGLISIAHPKFRSQLIKEAKKYNLIYRDQAFIPGKKGEYPGELETYRTTKTGMEIFMRPVKISDEPLLKDLFYSLSDRSMYRRFISVRTDMPHERLQDFTIIDYTKEMLILVVERQNGKEKILGIGQYGIDATSRTAEVAFVVRDDYQVRGIGTELLSYLALLARKQGLLGFTAEVLVENRPMMHLFESIGFNMKKRISSGTYELQMLF